jgi:hypothetical protein
LDRPDPTENEDKRDLQAHPPQTSQLAFAAFSFKVLAVPDFTFVAIRETQDAMGITAYNQAR